MKKNITKREKTMALPGRMATGIRGFFDGCAAEFRKVIWPDKSTMIKQLAAVVCVSVITAVLIAMIDFGMQNLVDILVTTGTP